MYDFTPPKHFINDPNGRVDFDRDAHLSYQHNPAVHVVVVDNEEALAREPRDRGWPTT